MKNQPKVQYTIKLSLGEEFVLEKLLDDLGVENMKQQRDALRKIFMTGVITINKARGETNGNVRMP